MRFFKSIISWWHGFFRKKRICVVEPESGKERWYTHLSAAGLTMSCVALISIIFAILLTLVAYTPLLDMMPGYRTEASRARETLIRNLIMVDSLERKMNDMLIYNENRILVVDGKTPTTSSVRTDSLSSDKSIVPPSQIDSLFRRQMEDDRNYTLVSSGSQHRSSINALKPIDGIITERFNAKTALYGIRITSSPLSQITAIANGTIISTDWLPEHGNSVTIQHDNGIISIYRNLSDAIITKGQRVSSGEVIGYSATEEHPEMLFEFEMWMGGNPLNPESYILF